MRAVTAPGRWVWGVSGLVTAVVLTVFGARLIAQAGVAGPVQMQLQGTVTRTVIVPQPITSLTVESYGAPVRVTAAHVTHVQVSETLGYDPAAGGPPAVDESVNHGHLSVGSPACSDWKDCISFAVIVPPDVTVTVASEDGPVMVSGTAGANLDSGGGDMDVYGIHGPLTVTTDGGPLQLADVTGPVQADTGGGSLLAQVITSATATVTTDGGPLQLTGSIGTLRGYTGGGQAGISLSAAPEEVTLDTDGGPAALAVPGGPYAVTADSDGGPQSVGIAANPSAARSITVSSGGGPLQIEPEGIVGSTVTGPGA